MEKFSAKLLSNETKEKFIDRLKKPSETPINYQTPLTTAAVLVPLCVVDGEVHILYTLRSYNLKNHSGQVSFPGGKTDEDETAIQTALRETEEELGLPREFIDIWCEMPPVVGTGKAIQITPVIGVIRNFNKTVLEPNNLEVEEVFTVPIRHFCSTEHQGFVNVTYKNQKIPLPVYIYKNYKIWGVTAIMTHFVLLNLLSKDVYKMTMSKHFEMNELSHSKL